MGAVISMDDASRIARGISRTGLAVLLSTGCLAGAGRSTRGPTAPGTITAGRSDPRLSAARTVSVPAGARVTAIAAGPRGGYLVLTSDGGVHNVGTTWHGSDAGRLPAGVTAVGLATDPTTGGYWILRSSGRVDNFRAAARGSLPGPIPAGAIATDIAAGRPGGYLIMTASGGAIPSGLAGRVWDVLPTSRRIVALTIDVGPMGGVKSILATLRRDHVRATFFVTGRRAREFKGITRSIATAGQLIGDHSNSHPHFTALTDTQIRAEVLSARTSIESVTGIDTWPWFRFPYGDHDARTVSVVNSAGFVPIGWTVDTLGWMGTSGGVTVREVVQRVLASRRPGEIVLMHGGSDARDGSTLDADALPTVIARLRAYGYSFVTIDSIGGFRAVARTWNGRTRALGTPSFGSDAGKLASGVTAVGLAADSATGGYWILRSTGKVDAFHAPEHGSLSTPVANGAVVTAIAAGRPGGYLILTSDGAVHAFGTPWHGSDAGKLAPGVTAVGLAANTATGGYWILRSTGRVDAFDAPVRGPGEQPS